MSLAAAAASRGSTAPHALHQIAGARLKSRSDTNEDGSGERDARGKEGDPTVDLQRVRKRQALGGRAAHECDERRREGNAHRSTDDSEQERFGEKLASESPATGTQRRAHGELASAHARAHEEEIRDVGARKEQNETDRCRD
jgi:hypothetical protein